MSKSYKLKSDIKEFIIQRKKTNPELSCRNLSALVKEQFQVDLSKSLINNLLKESNLSSPIGRRRVKEPIILTKTEDKPAEAQMTQQEADFMENGGFFFLKAADLKLDFTSRLAEVLSGYFPDLSKPNHQAIIEALIYSPFFEDKKSLRLLIGREVPEESLSQYSQQMLNIPFLQLKELAEKLGVNHNLNEINELWQKSLLRLNSYIVHFFPPEYQFLDFLSLLERFYCLPAKLERKSGLLLIQLFYPTGFYWVNDVIWQEGFAYAANRLNEAKILTPGNEQIWINPKVNFPEGNAFSTPQIFD